MKPLTEEEVVGLASLQPWGENANLQAHFEHDCWWVTDLNTGAAWSVHLNGGPSAVDFEQVSEGDDCQ